MRWTMINKMEMNGNKMEMNDRMNEMDFGIRNE